MHWRLFRWIMTFELSKTYGGVYEMAQKVIEGDVVTWRHMHVNLRWPEIRTIHFLFDFGSKYESRVKILRWPTFFSPKTLRWPKIRTMFASNSISLRILFATNWFSIWMFIQWMTAYCQRTFDGLCNFVLEFSICETVLFLYSIFELLQFQTPTYQKIDRMKTIKMKTAINMILQ